MLFFRSEERVREWCRDQGYPLRLSFAKTGAALLPVTIATSRDLIADHDDWQA
jgi:hypothetical protein